MTKQFFNIEDDGAEFVVSGGRRIVVLVRSRGATHEFRCPITLGHLAKAILGAVEPEALAPRLRAMKGRR